MAAPSPSPADRVAVHGNEEDADPIFTFSRGLTFARGLAFGSLAIGGCLVTQCVLATWIALLAALAKVMLLQARILEGMYGKTKPAPKKKKKVINIEIKSLGGAHPQKVQPIKRDFLFDEDISLQIRSSASKGSLPPVNKPGPRKLDIESHAPDLLPEHSSAVRKAQPVELEFPSDEATFIRVNVPTPQTSLPVTNPEWQTKTLQERKVGDGRAYAVKQVDVFTPGNDEQLESFLLPTSGTVDAPFSFFGPLLGTAGSPVYVPRHVSATSAVSPPSGAATAREKSIPSFLSTFPSTLKPAPTPTSIVKLPATRYGAPGEPHGQKKELAVQSSALESEQRQADSAPKRARRSAIKLVHVDTPQRMPPNVSKSQTDNSAEVKANEHSKLEISKGASKMASAGADLNTLGDVEPVKIGQLRHRFIETSVLKDRPAEIPQHRLLPAIQSINPEEAAREALVIAFHERESTRLELIRNYSDENVERFSQKAQEYKARRKALAVLMPSRELSFEDEASFPFLSSKDTVEPQVTTSAVRESNRPSPLPSPPATSEEDNGQHFSRPDSEPLLANALRAYQYVLQATKNMEKECHVCNEKFCLNGYSPAGQRKMKSAKDLYEKSRSKLMDSYEPGQLPESLARQFPVIGGC